jgi:hypothetical protein
MTESSRGPVLTTFAVLFAILAISNFLKPFHLDPNAGFVFFGMKTHGVANAILGPAFRRCWSPMRLAFGRCADGYCRSPMPMPYS